MVRSLLPLLGCGVMMAACMLLMGRGARRAGNEPVAPGDTEEVAALRDEVARLRAVDDQRRAAVEDPGR